MKRLKIAVLNPEFDVPRGAQRQAIMLAREYQKAGHEVLLYTGSKAPDYPFEGLMADLSRVVVTRPWTRHLRRGGLLPGSNIVRLRHTRAALRDIARELEREKCDVVHAHNHPAQWIASETTIPVVWTCNEPPYWHFEPTLRNRYADVLARLHDNRNARRIHAVLVLSRRMADLVGGAYPSHVPVWTGSGCELSHPLPSRGEAPPKNVPRLRQEQFHVLSVLGGLYGRKRPFDHLRAVAKSGIPGAALHLIGADVEGLAPSLRAEAKALGVELDLQPRVSEAHLHYLLSNCDATLFIPELEPWGIFPCEAMLAGLPVVLSDGVGARDALPSTYPYVAAVGDVAAAGAHLASIHEDTYEARATVRALHGRLAVEFSWAACARRALDVLEQAA